MKFHLRMMKSEPSGNSRAPCLPYIHAFTNKQAGVKERRKEGRLVLVDPVGRSAAIERSMGRASERFLSSPPPPRPTPPTTTITSFSSSVSGFGRVTRNVATTEALNSRTTTTTTRGGRDYTGGLSDLLPSERATTLSLVPWSFFHGRGRSLSLSLSCSL